MTVVDTDKKWILTGQDAAAYVQVTPSLLSLIVNISQGTLPIAGADPAAAQNEQTKQRQTFLDAEWQQFLDGSLNGVSSLVKGWPLDSAVLAVHAKHAQPAKFPYSFWTAQNGPDLRTMVTALYATAGPSAAAGRQEGGIAVAHLHLGRAYTQGIGHNLGERRIRALAMRGDPGRGRDVP